MSERKDDEGKKPDDLPPKAPAEHKSSGRVAFDARGNPIWEWQLETGVYSRDVSTQKLKKLDLGELSLVDTGVHRKPPDEPEAAQPRKALPGGGFNPYDSSPVKQDDASPYDRARAAAAGAKQPATPPAKPAPPPRTPADLRKLDEWVKMKKRLGEAKDDE